MLLDPRDACPDCSGRRRCRQSDAGPCRDGGYVNKTSCHGPSRVSRTALAPKPLPAPDEEPAWASATQTVWLAVLTPQGEPAVPAAAARAGRSEPQHGLELRACDLRQQCGMVLHMAHAMVEQRLPCAADGCSADQKEARGKERKCVEAHIRRSLLSLIRSNAVCLPRASEGLPDL